MSPTLSRREMLRTSVAAAALAFSQIPLDTFGFTNPEDGAVLLPFADVQPVDPRRPMTKWENLTSWQTPSSDVFSVSHYGTPKVDLNTWKLEVTGLVKQPHSFTLDDLKRFKKKSVFATLECSGNSSNAGFMGAIGNVKWTGVPVREVLHECAPLKRAIEAVFFGADEKVEKIREKDYLQNFARALDIDDARRDEVILAYEMNDEPLVEAHGAPLRLIVPGWFGIAWVKWLTRIELLDRRYMSKYMAREYVTIRGEEKDGKTIWRETSVGPIDVKSIVARALKLKDGTIRFGGAAWTDGTPLKRAEIKIDGGEWQQVSLQRKKVNSPYAWTFWDFDWKTPSPGEHTIVSRAIDTEGRIQPAFEDPEIKLKRTYWEANQQWPRKLKI